MSFKKPKADLSPVKLVAAHDPALDWRGEEPPSSVVQYAEAPIKPGERPDVIVVRPLNYMEAKACGLALKHSESVVNNLTMGYRLALDTGILEIHLGDRDPATTYEEVWDAIQTHQVDEVFLDGVARWLVEGSRGNPESRFPLAASAQDSAADSGPAFQSRLREMSAREALQ